MTRWIPIAIVLFLLAGCGFTQTGDTIRTLVKEGSLQAMSEGLNNALWFQCELAAIGAVKRKFQVSAEMADAYNTVCDVPSEARIIKSPN